ncbi:MAG: hypothetical protein MMC33_010286 [Icmadophila ericetorum]|nr:hypothetical protein [Icmadophila ericetorum]
MSSLKRDACRASSNSLASASAQLSVKSGLLNLPTEIRLEIYTFVFFRPIRLQNDGTPFPQKSSIKEFLKGVPKQLLLSCRKIYNESYTVMFSTNTFPWPSHSMPFLPFDRLLLRSELCHIRSILIDSSIFNRYILQAKHLPPRVNCIIVNLNDYKRISSERERQILDDIESEDRRESQWIGLLKQLAAPNRAEIKFLRHGHAIKSLDDTLEILFPGSLMDFEEERDLFDFHPEHLSRQGLPN